MRRLAAAPQPTPWPAQLAAQLAPLHGLHTQHIASHLHQRCRVAQAEQAPAGVGEAEQQHAQQHRGRQRPAQQQPEDATAARLYALYGFVAAHGRLPAVSDRQGGVAVGQWAEACRLSAAAGELEPRLADALASIPGWDWVPQTHDLESSFEASLQTLLEYARRQGRLPKTRTVRHKPPAASAAAASAAAAAAAATSASAEKRAVEQAATALCRRVLEQRKRGVLTLEQVEYVSAVLPGWRWDPRVRSPPLDELLVLLREFAQQHGRLPKADEKLPSGFLIGEWCAARRSEFSRGALETDVAAAIAEGVPGWTWNHIDSAFEASLAVLRDFAAQHGRMPTQREEWQGVRIGAWCNKRRLQHKRGGMPADRAAALESVPGWWWTADDMPG